MSKEGWELMSKEGWKLMSKEGWELMSKEGWELMSKEGWEFESCHVITIGKDTNETAWNIPSFCKIFLVWYDYYLKICRTKFIFPEPSNPDISMIREILLIFHGHAFYIWLWLTGEHLDLSFKTKIVVLSFIPTRGSNSIVPRSR